MGTWTEFEVTAAFPLLVTFKIGIEVTFGVCTVIGVDVFVDYADLIVVYVFSLIDVCCMDDEVEVEVGLLLLFVVDFDA